MMIGCLLCAVSLLPCRLAGYLSFVPVLEKLHHRINRRVFQKISDRTSNVPEGVACLSKRPSNHGQTRAIGEQAFFDAGPLTTAQVFRECLVINLAVLIEGLRRREFADEHNDS